MKKSLITLKEIKLVGITARTNNSDEMNPEKGKIGPTLEKYFGNNLTDKIQNRKSPCKTFCIYTEYESDETGEYTYFVGEEVNSFEGVDASFKTLTIPIQSYAKFNIGPGKMPQTCIKAWQKIWKMTDEDFGSARNYIADFEIYDKRSTNPENCVFDIYIGVK